MKKIMLIGRSGCGKTTLAQAIRKIEQQAKKTQTIEYSPEVIDTPGEYVEKRYYSALIVTAADCDIIAFVQDCQDEVNYFPPGLAALIGKKAIGILTKMDRKNHRLEHNRQILKSAGVGEIFEVSAAEDIGIDKIRALLKD
ncbi:MAG: EutP/PduV family microcompartment system protein [Thermotaleaceae bacterium]